MTRPDWTSIKRDYVETTMTLAEVQAKWGVRRGTLSARATRQKWHDQKQQFAAKFEQQLREKNIAKRVAEHEKFDDDVGAVARGQLGMIARQMRDAEIDAAKLLKLANALEKVQRVGATAFGGMGANRTGDDLG
jgi:hypothetical protein